MAVPRVVFRLEFGGPTGWGHLARCAALAAALRERGWTCALWTRGDPTSVPADLCGPFTGVMPASDWTEDIPSADFLVIDWYGATDEQVRQWKSLSPATSLVVIDDEELRRLDAADLIINSRLGLRHARYQGQGRTLLGEAFVLLRPGLARPRSIPSPFAASDWPVLVMIGGSDPRGLTRPVLEGLADAGGKSIAPVVIGGGNSPGELADVLSTFRKHLRLERVDAAELAGWAHLCRGAVIGCGGSVYELAYLQLPFIGIVVAENQQSLAREVNVRWRLPVLDGSADIRGAVASAVRNLTAIDPATQGFAGIDGEGARRVADAMAALRRER